MLSNQLFCYWLQGYFEISPNATLDAERVKLIQHMLQQITEIHGTFTAWLNNTLLAIEANDYPQILIEKFTPIIQEELNNIFIHVIDQSYCTEKSLDHLKRIHDGKQNDK